LLLLLLLLQQRLLRGWQQCRKLLHISPVDG
jgi:hypothetical protein